MPVQLGKRSEHSFDQPLGLLSDCHRRIEHFLEVLQKVLVQVGQQPLEGEARQAVEAALRYFQSAAPRHTQDEENSLFPLLRNSAAPQVQAAMAKVQALEAEHELADVAHREADSGFRQWLDAGPLAPQQVRQLEKTLADLRELYRRHIQVEDREIFPLAGQVLSRDQLNQLGREMAERRGLLPPHSPGQP